MENIEIKGPFVVVTGGVDVIDGFQTMEEAEAYVNTNKDGVPMSIEDYKAEYGVSESRRGVKRLPLLEEYEISRRNHRKSAKPGRKFFREASDEPASASFKNEFTELDNAIVLRIQALGDDRITQESDNYYIYAEDGKTHIGSLIKKGNSYNLVTDMSIDEFKTAIGLSESRQYKGYKGRKINERDYDTATRDEFAAKGWAMKDGSFPIKDEKDLMNAIHRAHQASDPTAARNHIKKRAKDLGLTDKIPEDWK